MAIPTITTNRLILLEGQTVDVFTDDLNATVEGVDVSPNDIVFTIEFDSEAALAGDFLLEGSAEPVFSFSLADVEEGRVSFQHDRTNNAPQYSVVASATVDGLTESSAPDPAEVSFTATNDAPRIVNNVLSITEGGTVTLDPTNLQATDEAGESTAEELTYTIKSVSASGQFFRVEDGVTTSLEADDLSTAEIEANSQFTQADVNAGLIQFVHDGSETAPSYTLNLTDGGVPGTGPLFDPITTNANTVTVESFIPVNDAPVITKNNITLQEGGIVNIGTNNLAAEDVEDAEGSLTFTVTSITNGRFELVENGVVTEVLASPTTAPVAFTQEQIFQGQVRFVNDPATDEAPTYTIEVTDSGILLDDGTLIPPATDTKDAIVTFTALNDVPTLQNLAIAIEEGEQVTLSSDNLLVEDEESSAAGLTYQVTSSVASSFIRESTGLEVQEFTQADINAGDIAYQHDGSTTTPSFSLTVTDEGGESIIIDSGNAIAFGPINDPPEVVRAQIDVIEGQPVRLTASENLLVTDEESLSGQLVYTVEITNQDPTKPDSFIVAGEVQTGVATFTQAQVGAGQVQFIHGGSNFAPDLAVTVSDEALVEGTEPNVVPVDLAVSFTATNDEPQFLTNTLSIEEGGTVLLNNLEVNLLTKDEETTDPANLTYTINSVSNGTFQRIDTPEITSLEVGDTFTQADVDAGFIQFVQDGSELPPNYRLTVNDTGINGDPATIQSVSRTVTIPEGGFTNVNDAPTIENSSFALTEGDTVTLTLDQLSATDPETADADLLFTVTSVTNGRFERVTVVDGVETVEVLAAPDLAEPLSFSQAEVEQRLIRFVNDPATDEEPTFTVEVSDVDPVNPLTDTQAGVIAFTAIDDDPELQTLSLTLTEGETVPITSSVLSVVDEETPSEGIVYTVDAVNGGSFIFAADETPADIFTQADINAGNIIAFKHDGLNDAPTFSLTASDGVNAITITETLLEGVDFTPTNDEPVVEVSQFTVNEGGTVVLSGTTNLKTVDEESTSSGLIYTVTVDNTANPDNPDGFLVDGTLFTGPDPITFTQAQVNAGQVSFVQGGANTPPAVSMTVADEAIAEGGSPNIIDVPLEILFDAQNDEPNFITNTLAITEGGTVVLNLDSPNLVSKDEESSAAELTYAIDSVSNGEFQRIDELGNATPITEGTFTQAEVDAGAIQFVHDGGELAPNYVLTVSDNGINDDPATILSVQRELTIPEGDFININDAPILENNTLTLQEGDAPFLTLENLQASDVEDEDSALVFTITSVTNGRFERVTTVDGTEVVEVLASPTLETPLTFTQAEIEAGQIRFVNDPATDEAPTYTVQVQDLDTENPGITTEAAEVIFNIVNDVPELTTLSFSLTEGDVVPLTDAVLAVVDEETPPEGITYTVNAVNGGSFVFTADGSPADTFTQADINTGNIVEFRHNGLNEAPTFSLTVSDGENELIVTDADGAGVTFIPINDAPVIEANTFAVTEGERVLITSEQLSTADEESPPEELLYTVTVNNADPENPDGFEIAGELFTGPDPITFTQADVDAELVTFVHGGSNFAPDVSATVTDTFPEEFGEPITEAVGLTIAFDAVNDPPEVVNNSLTITEGETLTLTPDTLLTTDEETLPENLTYTVEAIANGAFQRVDPGLATATPIDLGETFTQAEVNAGAIQFVHDGGEVAPSYTLTVTDTPLVPDGVVNSETFEVSIPEGGFIKVNDAPTLEANTLTIPEGGTVVFSAANLAASDPDSALSQLLFSVSEVTGGTFFLEGEALAEGTTFTSAAIAFKELSFVDDGDEVPPTYTITVTDPQGEATTAPATVVFEPVNDAPEIVTNTFTIKEGRRLTLNNPVTGVTNLLAEDNETDAAELVYEVSDVVGGEFFDFAANPISTFTQAELEQGDINFVHDGTETVPTFTITVRDPENAEDTVAADVTFEPVNDPPVLGNNFLAVTEAGETILTTDNFSASDPDSSSAELTFLISDLEGGLFALVGEEGTEPTPITSFTQAQVEAQEIRFIDDGDEIPPTFSVAVQDQAGATSPQQPGVVEFTRINDAPVITVNAFTITEDETLILNNPVTGVINLQAEDEETLSDAELTYTVNNVVGGQFLNAQLEPVSSFTQAALNQGTVRFVHDGTETVPSFELTVTDAEGSATDAIADIEYVPVNDAPVLVNNQIAVTEGAATLLSDANFLAEDPDTPPEALVFNVTEVIGGEFTDGLTSFTQAQITAGEIEFIDDGDQEPPTIKITVSDEEFTTEPTTIIISEFINSNDPPTAIADSGEGFTTTEDDAFVTASVLANDFDIDPGDTINVTQVNGQAVAEGTVELASGALVSFVADGTFEYDPNGQFDELGEGETTTDSFEYSISDAAGETASATVTVEILGVNDAPTVETNRLVITRGETQILSEDYILAIDPDSAPTELVFTASDIEGGEFLLNGTATETFTQQDILQGAVSFAQDGTETAPTYSLSVTDGLATVDPSEVDVERFVPVNIGAISGGIFDYSQFLRFQNPTAPIPADELNGLPFVQFFDEQFYLNTNPDVAAEIASGNLTSGYQHFVANGLLEGRNPSVLYDEDFYLANSPDVAAAVERGEIASGLVHYLNNGASELRRASPFFNQSAYLDNNPDVLAAVQEGLFSSGFEHYIEFGAAEQRDPRLFLYNEAFYLDNNPDVELAVEAGEIDSGFEHFVTFGQVEGRAPSILYDETSYLALNADVQAAVAAGDFRSGFSHYVQFGRFEDREIFA